MFPIEALHFRLPWRVRRRDIAGAGKRRLGYPATALEFPDCGLRFARQRCSIVPEESPRSGDRPTQPAMAGVPAPEGDFSQIPPAPAVAARAARRTYDEDRLDLLENAQRSAGERRRTDLRFFGLTFLLFAVLLIVVAGAILLWRHLSAS